MVTLCYLLHQIWFLKVALLETLQMMDVNQEINYVFELNRLYFKTQALFSEVAR